MHLNFNSELRLDHQQKKALEIAFENLNVDVYLFGSRTNPSAKGGDVDVFVLHDGTPEENYLLRKNILQKFQQICDERIDIVVLPPIYSMDYSQKIFFESTDKICLTS